MAASRTDFHLSPQTHLQGELVVPGDKSISHRALMLSALTKGQSQVSGFLPGEDTLATGAALQALGVDIEYLSATELVVQGVGLQGFQSPTAPLDLGNSGTSTRLFSGILAGAGIHCELIGDASLMTRPMQRVVTPLLQMGADIRVSEDGTLPMHIGPAQQLQGINYVMPVASAQLKSCLLLAGLQAEGRTQLQQPATSRDHTERMLRAFGVEVQEDGLVVAIEGKQTLTATDITIPGDISSAAFFLVGALIAEQGDVLLPGVGINPTRDAIVPILQQMGGQIEMRNKRLVGAEPVADLHVKSSRLQGIQIPESLVPIAIDEFPAILIAAACAEGDTVLHGAKELRVKESDRIRAMVDGLRQVGIDVEEYDDGMRVTGGRLQGGKVDSHTDHRIAMAFSMAALAASDPIHIHACDNVATSFPNFCTLAGEAGLNIEQVGVND